MIFRFVAVLTVLLVLGAGVLFALKGQDAVSALSDQLSGHGSSSGPDDGYDKKAGIKAKRKICASLSDAERRALISVPTPTRLLDVEGGLDHYTCRWAVRDYRTKTAYVEAMAAPASAWAENSQTQFMNLPLSASGRAKLMNEVLHRKDLGPLGCRLARELFQAEGAPHGADHVTLAGSPYLGTGLIEAQSCVHGTFYEVVVTSPLLHEDQALMDRAGTDLRKLERTLR